MLDVGLKATRNTIGAPFVIPPFTPPAPFFTAIRTFSVVASLDGETTATLGTLRGGTGAKRSGAIGGASRSEAVEPPELASPTVRRLFVVGPDADSQTILGDWVAPQPDSLVITVL